jgi:type I pantothenate kinase
VTGKTLPTSAAIDRRRGIACLSAWRQNWHDLRVHTPELLRPLLDEVRGAARANSQTLLIGVAGSVGVGKTTFAENLAGLLGLGGPGTVGPLDAQTISTDGFLRTNKDLDAHGLLDRKGFPESYDHASVLHFTRALREESWPLCVPRYSHQTFDIVEGSTIDHSSILIVEGINALQSPLREAVDVGIYLHAEHEVVSQWFVERMLRFIDDAKRAPGGFYDRFVDWTIDRQAAFAQHVWDTINLPNLKDHIEPTAAQADWVVEFDVDHSVRGVVRNPR